MTSMLCEKCGAPLGGREVCPACGSGAKFYRASTPSPTGPGTLVPPVAADSESVARVVADRFDVLRTLGMGGVGMVYLVRERQSQELFALKLLRPSLRKNTEVVARFRREVELARRLDHPNVAKVYSFNEVQGHMFILMQYIDGLDLGEWTKRGNPGLEQKLAVLKAVCAAVDVAHAAGVIHRDLKPGNIRITKDGVPFVLDFGVASSEEGGDITRVGAFIGTPLYMSPEQAQGKRVDPRTDIYSLGAVFYELVTGRPPFIGESAITIALKHIRETPFRPRSINPEIPPVVEAAILHCLEKDPKSRPQRAADIVREVEESIGKEREAERVAARQAAQEPHSGELSDISLFQFLRVLAPIRRNFVLEIVNNDEFGRYHFRGAHLVHAEAGNLRDEEVAYNLFYWTRGTFRVIDDAEPPPRETVSIPWIPFVEKYFEQVRSLIQPVHTLAPGPLIFDLIDPKGASVFRYVSDERFERALGERAKLGLEVFQRARTHLKSNDLLKVAKNLEDCGTLFCRAPGLRHYIYVLTHPQADLEKVYRWLKGDLEQGMIGALHDSLKGCDRKLGGKAISAKVLVGESEDFLGNLMRIKFRALGMDVYLVREGSKLIEIAPQFRPDVVLLNVDIPGVSGYDVCRMMSLDAALAKVPVVLLSPPGKRVAIEEMKLPGVTRVLEKPLVLDELVDVVRRSAATVVALAPVSRGQTGVFVRPV